MSTEKVQAIRQPAKTRPIGSRVFHFLISMKLALTLLLVVAIISIMGTLIPQGQDVINSGWVNNPLYDFYNSKVLNLFNMYSSWWFEGILGLLLLNLSMCIINRLPTTWKHARHPRIDVRDAFLANQPQSAVFEGAGQKGIELAGPMLKNRRYRLHTGKSGTVLAQKGRLAPLWSILFHLSFLVIATGFLMGNFLGFEEYVQIPDGKTVNVPNTDYRLKSYGFKIGSALVYAPGHDGDPKYVINEKTSSYTTDLELLTRDGQSLARQTITVNGPMRYQTSSLDFLKLEGFNVYQSSYAQGNSGWVTILEVAHKPGKTLIYIGFALSMLGIVLGLYFPHRRIWLKVGESGELLIGGRTNRSKLGFKRDFERIAGELRLRLAQEA